MGRQENRQGGSQVFGVGAWEGANPNGGGDRSYPRELEKKQSERESVDTMNDQSGRNFPMLQYFQ